jgi:caffeoyl-CoA O-methyltransferase
MTEIISTELRRYLVNLVPERPAVMRDMEAHAFEVGFPIIGPAAGYFCYQQARMMRATKVFELGSGYGYSTAWFAMAVQENGGGSVDHVVWDEGLSRKARRYLSDLGFDDIIRYSVGEAVQALSEAEGPFDLIFSDIDKGGYPASLPVIESKLRPGGILITDNALLRGRIFDRDDRSVSTEGVREYTQCLREDPNWITSVVPIRDGLIVALRR